jgi:hypothetical protein
VSESDLTRWRKDETLLLMLDLLSFGDSIDYTKNDYFGH